jgi:TrmH family RNA methyltransferase
VARGAGGASVAGLISSAANPKARYVRRLSRRAFRAREGKVVLEGVRLVEQATSAGAAFDFVLTDPDLDRTERGRALRLRLAALGIAVYEVTPGLLSSLSDTATPQGVLAVAAGPLLSAPSALRSLLVLDGVRDPGNLGTCLRTALAAGVDAALLAPGTADPSSAKVLRAASGAHFRLPVLREPWAEVAAICRAHALAVWVADARGSVEYTAVDWAAPWALVVGGEAEGASTAALERGRTVRIPMPGAAESLNVASATAVLLFEAARQRAIRCP